VCQDDVLEGANRAAQDTLSIAQLQMIFVFAVRNACFVHNVRTDVVSPQERRDLQSLTEIPGLVGHDVHIASPGAPKAKRTLLFEQVLHRDSLIRGQSDEDPFQGDL